MSLLTLLLACVPTSIFTDDTGGLACTDIAMASVSVTVTDLQGATLPEASVTYTLDGVDQGACEAWPGGGWVCGIEVAGPIEVTASAPGYGAESRTVNVVMDAQGCHVVGQRLTLALPEAPCEGDANTSVFATLVGSGGETLESPLVAWRNADLGDAPWTNCTPSDLGWRCGVEVSGRLDIQGTASGHSTAMALVDVPLTEDGCHVLPQAVELVVGWLPD